MRLFLILLYVSNTVAHKNVEIIPTQLLCPLCISILKSFSKQAKVNPIFEEELKASCESHSESDINQMAICRSEFTDLKMETLKTKTPIEICEMQKLCEKNETTEISSKDHRGVPDFVTIPEVRNSIDEPVPGEDVVKKLLDVARGKKKIKGHDLKIHFDVKFLPPVRSPKASSTTKTADDNTTTTVKPADS